MIEVKTPEQSWIEAQTCIDVFNMDFNAMHIKECSVKLKELFDENRSKIGNYDPVIFFDHFEHWDTEILTYARFVLLRLTGLVVILTGCSVDFTMEKNGYIIPDLDCEPFCVMFTNLPKYPKALFRERFGCIRETVLQTANLPIMTVRLEFLAMVEAAIAEERPAHKNVALQILKDIALDPSLDDAESLLQAFLFKLHQRRAGFMSDVDNYFITQLFYTSHRGELYRNLPVSHFGFVFEQRADYCPAYRGPIDILPDYNDRKICFPAMTLTYDKKASRPISCVFSDRTTCKSLWLYQVLKRFEEEPFASLAFCTSPLTGPYARPLLPDRWGCNTKLANVVYKICFGEKRFSFTPYYVYDRDRLLAMAQTALVHSLAYGGFGGQKMSSWFNLFIECMLEGNLMFETDGLLQGMRGLRVPFCGPVGEPWNEHVLRYVIGSCGGRIGMVHRSELLSSIDLTVTDEAENVIIQWEVFEESLYPSRVLLTLQRFMRTKSKLDIIIGFDWYGLAMLQKYLSRNSKFSKVTVLYLTREEKEQTATIRLLYGDPKYADRYLLLIGFENILFG